MSSISFQEKIGEGGNGAVLLAEDHNGSLIAVKAFKGSDKKTKAQTEYTVGSGLHHLNLGRCYGWSETPVDLTQFGL